MRSLLRRLLAITPPFEAEKIISQFEEIYNDKKTIVCKTDEDNTEWVNIDDICYIIKVSNKITHIYTQFKCYFYSDKTIDLIEELNNYKGFILGDRKTLINLGKVKLYDSFLGYVYFENSPETKIKTQIHIKVIKERIKAIIGHDKDINQMKDPDKFWLLKARET